MRRPVHKRQVPHIHLLSDKTLERFPAALQDPITHEVMRDPVMLDSGITYDRMSLQKWRCNGRYDCPKTRMLCSRPPIINWTVREWLEQITEAELKKQMEEDTAASQARDPEAMVRMGRVLVAGGEEEAGQGYFRAASIRDSPDGLYEVGIGLVKHGQVEEGFKFLGKSSLLGSSDASIALGLWNLFKKPVGEDGRCNAKDALDMFTKAIGEGDVRGYYGMGLIRISMAVQGDLEAARCCFLRAHHAGVASATYYLFLIEAATSQAHDRDVQAWAYLKEAVARDHVQAIEKYGELNLGSPIPMERAEALKLLSQVARTYQSPRALYLVEMEAASDVVTAVDLAKAFRILTSAAERGSEEAGLALGVALVNGHGCQTDMEAAALRINHAVAAKVPGAMVALGRLRQKRGDLTGMIEAFRAAVSAGEVLLESKQELCKPGGVQLPLASDSE
jgi:TPR repeat protein